MREFYQNVPKKIENKFSKTFFFNFKKFSKIKKKKHIKTFFQKISNKFFQKITLQLLVSQVTCDGREANVPFFAQ